MQVPKPSDADKERFRTLVPDDPRVEVKPMFGNLGAFVNGNMFAGLYGSSVGVKLGDDDRDKVLAAGGGPYGPAERPMGGWVSLPERIVDDATQACAYLTRALEHVAGMPPKKTRKAG
jgi:TfoX/Sxy family transcriptional regulator of competence genes